MQAALIIINGYPGVGKSTIAKELAALFPNSHVLDVKVLDELARVHSDGTEGNIAMRRELRQGLLSSLPKLSSGPTSLVSSLSLPTSPPIYILPETLFTNPHHRALIDFYTNFAATNHFSLISIILPLPMDVHLERATKSTAPTEAHYASTQTQAHRNPDQILGMRMTDDPAHFFPATGKATGWEWEVDTKSLGSESSAFRVAEYVMEGLRADGCFVNMRKARR